MLFLSLNGLGKLRGIGVAIDVFATINELGRIGDRTSFGESLFEGLLVGLPLFGDCEGFGGTDGGASINEHVLEVRGKAVDDELPS